MSIIRLVIALLSGIATSFVRTWQAFRKGKVAGKAEMAAEVTQQTIASAAQAKEIRNEVEALPPDELRRRASRWVRGATKDKPDPKG